MIPTSEHGVEKKINESSYNEVPLGYKFLPWHNQLIQTFLLPKLLGQQIPGGTCNKILEDINVYQSDPDQLPFDRLKHCQPNQGYFFVPEKTTTQGKDTPTGHWEVDIQQENLPIHREWIPSIGQWKGDIIGSRTTLTFFRFGVKTNWKMTEYKCDPCPDVDQKYLICKIELEQDSESDSSDYE